MTRLLVGCVLGLFLALPAMAAEYDLPPFSINNNQEQVLIRLYREECRRLVARGQDPLPGLSTTCTGDPTHEGKVSFIVQELLLEKFRQERARLQREQAAAVAGKFQDLSPAKQQRILEEAEVE